MDKSKRFLLLEDPKMAEEDGEKRAIEQQLEAAVCARIQHFKDQADSLTLESVRRLLEEDLGLEKFSLDAHKRFIRQFLEKKMDDADYCNSKAATENVDQDAHSSKEEEKILHKQQQTKADPKKPSAGDEEMMEDSPIMGVLTPKSEVGTQNSSLNESRIEEAIWERADHFRTNSEKLTLAGVRRLLEEDLGLNKNALDAFKTFISQQIDQVLSSPKGAKSVKGDVRKKASKNIKSKRSKKVSSDEESNTSHSESDEMDDKVKPRKEAASKKNIKKLEQPKKRKISEKSDGSGKRQNKPVKRLKVEDDIPNEDGSVSEDGQSQSSVEKPAQRKVKTAPGYGKQVEDLKSIIKACGMSVAPTIYRKAKQVAEDKRETFIVKELEGILSREGLSKNPTEKEIKDCRKRKETARELEGIDMSNIISSSRRRSTFSFVAPKKPAQKDKIDAKDGKKRDNKDKDRKHDNEEEEKEEKKEKDEERKEEGGKDGDAKEPAEEEEKDDDAKEPSEEEEKDDDAKEPSEEEVEEEEDEEEEEEEDDDESEDFNEDDGEDSD